MVIFQDVTDVVDMEACLLRSERLAAIGELSASIAHEIRNPLAAISGSIEMLQCQRSGSAKHDWADPEQLMRYRAAGGRSPQSPDFTDFLQVRPPRTEQSWNRSQLSRDAIADVMKMFKSASQSDTVDIADRD